MAGPGPQLDAAGFDTVWAADHVGLADPFGLLMAAAGATERLRVGTYMLNAEFWNPLLLARTAATVTCSAVVGSSSASAPATTGPSSTRRACGTRRPASASIGWRPRCPHYDAS